MQSRMTISPFQQQLIFSENEFVLACCGRAAGKTEGVTGRIAVRNIKYGRSAMLIAPTFGLIRETIMPATIGWFEKFGMKVKPNWSDHTITTKYGRVVFLSGTRPDSPRGYTNLEDFYCDEAAYIPRKAMKNGLLACRSNKGMTTTQCYTSTGLAGSYFNKMAKEPPVKDHLILKASTFDNPFTTDQYKRTVYESLLDTPAFLRQELFGDLDAEEINLVFPPSSFSTVRRVSGGRKRCGIDFAYEGNDRTCIFAVDDNGIVEKKVIGKDNGRKCFEEFKRLHQKYNFESLSLDHTGGFDAGFIVLMEQEKIRVPVNKVNFGAASPDPKFGNMRAYIYFNARRMIVDEGFYIGDDEVEDELVPQTYFMSNGGHIMLTPKKYIKSMIGKSPDLADALCLACYKGNPQPLTTTTEEPEVPESSRRY